MHRIAAGLALVAALVAASLSTSDAQALPNGSWQASCGNPYMRGSVLTATCSAANGQRITSSLNMATCRSNDVANNNGYLACGGAPAGGGHRMPGGSWQASCTNSYMRGSVLTANCSAANGQRITSSINMASCRSNDVANNNGYLACAGGGGGHPGGGYPGGGRVPNGSYQASCVNVSMQGAILTATCTGPSGGRVTSRLNVQQCPRGNDILNRNGYLSCT